MLKYFRANVHNTQKILIFLNVGSVYCITDFLGQFVWTLPTSKICVIPPYFVIIHTYNKKNCSYSNYFEI